MKKWLALLIVVAASILLLINIGYRRSHFAFVPMPATVIDIQEATYPVVEEQPDNRAQLIDAYFERKKMPLAGYGKKFVEFADRDGHDYRLVPAVSVRESSGGLQACGNNPLGWGSCELEDFESVVHAIDYVSSRLANSPLYKGKSVYDKLQTYNPPAIVLRYAEEVMAIMEAIGPAQ